MIQPLNCIPGKATVLCSRISLPLLRTPAQIRHIHHSSPGIASDGQSIFWNSIDEDVQSGTQLNLLAAIAGEDFWGLFQTDSRSDSVLAHMTYADAIAHGQSFAIHGAAVRALAHESRDAEEKFTLNFR